MTGKMCRIDNTYFSFHVTEKPTLVVQGEVSSRAKAKENLQRHKSQAMSENMPKLMCH